MARVTSDLQSENAAELPDWPGPGAARDELGDAPPPEGGGAGSGLDARARAAEGLRSDGTAARNRVRRGWERGRVWYRPEGVARPEPRGSLRERLVPPYYPEFFPGAGWILPLIVTAIGGVLRFWNLAWPNSIIFDETYYAKDGWSMFVYGWEHNWLDGGAANPALAGSGAFGHDGLAKFSPGAEFVAHPPIGKWVIGAGERVWGLNPVGWRIMEAALGTLAIYIIARAARRMFRSTLLGCVAGILFAFDGLSFVMARTALLDGIQMFFVVAGFACLLVDRDKTRARFADWREELGTTVLLPLGERGPKAGLRPWRLLAGVCLGLSTATKWNSIFFVAAFAVMTVLWDRGARRAVGLRQSSKATLIRDVPWAFLALPVTATATFVASYAGWFFDTSNGGGYDRFWADSRPSNVWPTWTNPLRSLWNYVGQQFTFNAHLRSPHPYQSNPWSWFVLGRPVAFYYEEPKTGTAGCTPSMGRCSAEVLALGNPLLWWFATASILFLLWRWIGRRDWRAAAILAGIAAGIVPWMWFAQRTIFSFYAVVFAPFMVLGATMAIGAILGRADASPTRRVWGAAVSGTLVVGTVALFAYFYPIYTGQTIPYSDWANHMWLPSWI
jgi:dolichyl-phosphate-mannose--protein O-mannosyl transferase